MNNKSDHLLTDKQLVQKVLQGDNRAFAFIIQLTEKLVASIVLKLINNPEDQKDLAQDIYLKAYNRLSGFQFQSKLSTWVAQIAYNTCFDYLKKKKIPTTDMPSSHPENGESGAFNENFEFRSDNSDAEHALLTKERQEILVTAIDSLPPLYKTLITLYHQEALSYEEIGTITNLPSGTVKNYLFRARKKMKDILLLQYKKEEL